MVQHYLLEPVEKTDKNNNQRVGSGVSADGCQIIRTSLATGLSMYLDM